MREQPWREDQPLPLVISPESAAERSAAFLADWLRSEQSSVERRLHRFGAILFRGFELDGAEQFRQLVLSFRSELRNYIEGQSQRDKVTDKIYNSTHYPPAETITLHNELSYTQSPPGYLFFFCDVPPGERGETPIVDCRALLETLPADTLARFENRGILYVKNMHGGKGFGKSWQEHFETEDRRVVEAYLKQGNVGFEWREDGALRTRQVRPAIGKHPRTGEPIWFNQATLWHVSALGPKGQTMLRLVGEDGLATNAYFDDGDAIEDDVMERIRRASWNQATFFAWERGDLLFVDNYLVAHGRNSYSGERNILVAMA